MSVQDIDANIDALGFREQASNPSASPGSGRGLTFLKDDGFYFKDEADVVYSFALVADAATVQTIILDGELTSVYLGDQVGTGGSSNVHIGQLAGAGVTTGHSNLFAGWSAGTTITEGFLNVGLGTEALASLTTGDTNVAAGYLSLFTLSTGDNNVAIGKSTLSALDTGSNNVAIGFGAALDTGAAISGSVAIGHRAGDGTGAPAGIASNQLYIHNAASDTPLIYGEFDNNVLKFNATTWLNSEAADFDTIIAGDTEPNLLRVDAGTDTVRLGDWDTNYAQFAIDGELTLVGTARVMKHVQLIDELGIGGTAPTVRITEEPYVSYTFAVNNDSHITFEIPGDMDFTEAATIKLHWYTSVDQTDDEVNWEARWNARAPGEAVNAGETTDTSGDVNCPTQWEILETTIETVPADSIAAGDLIGLHLERIAIIDGTNPSANSIHALSIEFEYTSNKLGLAT